MQKQVSKQNLAIVALSILLTIAIALSFTFAAFADKNTVTGNITFTAADLQVILAVPTTNEAITFDAESGNIVITLTDEDFKLTPSTGEGVKDKMEINSTIATAIEAITFQITTTTSNRAFTWGIAFGGTDASGLITISAAGLAGNSNANASVSAGVFLQCNQIDYTAFDDVQFVITVSATYNA